MSEMDQTKAPPAVIEREAAATLEHDYARCAQVTREASSNFYYAFILLPT